MSQPTRRGFALIIVLICLIVITPLLGGMLRKLTLSRRQHREQRYAAQANWLAASGVERAAVQLRSDPDFREESWPVSDPAWGGHRGLVDISVSQHEDDFLVTVIATFPADSPRSARKRRTARVTASSALTAAEDTPND